MLKPENYQNAAAYRELEEKKAEASEKLDLLYQEWEEASRDLEEAEKTENA